jgi:uncharacterized Rossmann fold enzyme
MDFATWEPVYEAIRADFEFDRAADERARDVLGALVDQPLSPAALTGLTDTTVAIVVPGPTLTDEIESARDADTVVAVSDAAAPLRDCGIDIDCHVTDLDGAPLVARELTHAGVPVVVHAHGDNVPLVRRHVPQMAAGRVVPTTQVAPAGQVDNVGGFTDGDRAAFLADHRGATRLLFVGWVLDDRRVGPGKRRKLRWAARLLYWLERRRNDRFTVLDGHREGLALPSGAR